MIRAALRLLPLLCLALAGPARADELVPYFAGGESPSPALKTVSQQQLDAEAQKNPWAGFYGGTEAYGVSGSGHGSRGGFGGDAFLGYNKEFANNVVVGFQGSSGYMPGLSNYGPRGYNFAMANVHVGYDMGRFMPYVAFGVGKAGASSFMGSSGFNSLNNAFSRSSQSVTLTRVGAGFNYAVTDKLHIGVEVDAVQAHGNGFGAPLQPGSVGIP